MGDRYAIQDVHFITVFLLVFYPLSSLASTWAKSYGGSNYEQANSIQKTSDGGYIVAGLTWSSITSFDCWVVKLDADGVITWQKTYGGMANATSIQETPDGGYIVAGYTSSYGAGTTDLWVLKLDIDGNITWQKTYGGSSGDAAYSIRVTSDGGYIVAGYTASYGAGIYDYWVLKLDTNGNVTWQKTYGGTNMDQANSIQATLDGGYIVAGYTDSFNASFGVSDYWVLKLDANGNVIWQKTYGGTSVDKAKSIQATSDGGYIVAGSTGSYGNNYWVLKLDTDGNVTWQKTYGDGSNINTATSIHETSDNGYIVAGYIDAYSDGHYADYWVLKLDTNGNVTWQKTYGGGSNFHIANSIQETSDSGYIVAGYTKGTGFYDYWVVKVDNNGNISGCSIIGNIEVVPANTSAIPEGSTAVPANTNVTPQASSAIPQISDISTQEQCFYNGASEPDFPWELFYPAFMKQKRSGK